jgi:hypothetical protein
MTSITRSVSRRTLLLLGGASLAAIAASGCKAIAPSPAAAPTPSPDARRATPTVILATSELVVGPNRFAVAIVDEANQPILDAKVTFGFFQVNGDQATKRAEAPGTFRWVEQRAKGIYTAPVTFDAPGRWGVEATLDHDGKRLAIRAPFDVKQTGSAPMIGQPAIRSKTLTPKDVKDLSELCTAAPPCELHATSLDELLANGKATAVLFASPGFCTSQTCAPQLDVLLQVRPKHADTINFAHVEIYKDPRNGVLADAVTEWNLPSEPWIFFVDRTGTIVERFDGIATAEEIEAGIAKIA